jgi:SAM-dependent methyltransferase
MTESAYDEVPYQGATIAHTAPEHLALASRFFGGPAPPLRGARVLELGCGMGRNLIGLAFHRPQMVFLGVDRSASYIAHAEATSRELGIDNVRWLAGDFLTLGLDAEPFDYVIVHGVLSWVPDATKHALLAVIANSLAPDGVAQVSFNAMPGWGLRRLMRTVLQRETGSMTQRVAGAQRRAARLRGMLGEPESVFQALIAHELDVVERAAPWYLAHDHLAVVNDPLWFRDFAALIEEHDLAYLGDAMVGSPEGSQFEALRGAMGDDGASLVEVEETIDLLGGRFMRGALLTRKDAPRSPPDRLALIEACHVASCLSRQSDPFEIAPGVEERFEGLNGYEIGVSDPLTKMALLILGTQWPRGVRMPVLIERARAMLGEHGLEGEAADELIDAITTLFGVGQIDLRLVEPTWPAVDLAAARPNGLTSWELASGFELLTSPLHVPIAFDADARAALEDGREVDEEVVAQAARWGLLQPPGDGGESR